MLRITCMPFILNITYLSYYTEHISITSYILSIIPAPHAAAPRASAELPAAADGRRDAVAGAAAAAAVSAAASRRGWMVISTLAVERETARC